MTELTNDSPVADARDALFAGPGEMRGRCRTFDWAATPLGAVDLWPQSLRTAVTTVLGSAFPNIVLWGPDLIQVYNDGYRELMGAKHPFGLGIPTNECWPEAWAFNGPIYDRVRTGETVYFEDVLIPLMRYGALEDVYFTLSYSPLLDETGDVGGVLVTCLDTTGRIAAHTLEEERRELLARVELERNRLGEVFRQAPAFLAVLRGEGHVFELANDSYYQVVGYRDIVGKPVAVALPEVVEQGFVTLLDRVLQTGEAFHGREVPVQLMRTPSAPPETRYVNFVYQAIAEPDGSYSGVVAHGTDVTDEVLARREVERLLAEAEARAAELAAAREAVAASERRLRDVFEQAPMAVAVLMGPEHVYTVASPAYALYLGGRPLLGRAFREAVPESGGQEVATLMDRVYATGEPVRVKEKVVPLDRNGDGVAEEYIFDISYQPLRGADGQVYAITSLSLDVTEQVRARQLGERATQAIAAAQQQLARVFSQAPVAISVLEGPQHRFQLANPTYEQLVGRDNLVGRTVVEALPELAGTPVLGMIDEVYRTGVAHAQREFTVHLTNGRGELEERWFDFSFQSMLDDTGAVYGVGVIAVDVSAQVQSRRDVERLLAESEASRAAAETANAQLELVNQQLQDNATELEAQSQELVAQAEALAEQTRLAEGANRAKSDFLATMSHELRTPLNAIAGYADLLLAGVRGPLTEPQELDVERMRRSGQHLLGLINSILNFTKLDAGEVEFDIQPTPLAALLDGLQDLVGPQLAAKSLTFSVAACDSGERVRADTDKARQILLNLLVNAVKFTEPGGSIAVACELDEAWARIAVRDTGRGIAPEQCARIFDPFVQIDRHLTPAGHQGVGLGLAISRDLALGMGGELSVESEMGKGSTFTLSLRRG